jgi:putative inorganic carbon (HCO3(-)) transporter
MDTSSEMRLAFWESTIAMILDHPLLGIGWGSYFMVYPNYDYYMQGNFIKIVHAHNMYLNFMAEIGLFGFASYMVCFFGVIYKAFKAQVMKLDILVKAMFLGIGLGLSALALNGFTDYVMFNTELSMLVWLFSGIVVSGYKN